MVYLYVVYPHVLYLHVVCIHVVYLYEVYLHVVYIISECMSACGLQADSSPPSMTDGGMVYSSEKCLNRPAETSTSVTDAMW